MFLSSDVGGSFRLDCSCLSILGVSDIVLQFVHYLFSGVFLVFQGQKAKISLLVSQLSFLKENSLVGHKKVFSFCFLFPLLNLVMVIFRWLFLFSSLESTLIDEQ